MTLVEARKLFNLSANYTMEELNSAYKNLIRKWHPDTNKSAEALEKTQEINSAKDLLKNALTSTTVQEQRVKQNHQQQSNHYYSKIIRNVYSTNNPTLVKKYKFNDVLVASILKIENIIKELEYEDTYKNYILSIIKINTTFLKYIKWFCEKYKLSVSYDETKIMSDKFAVIVNNRLIYCYDLIYVNNELNIIYFEKLMKTTRDFLHIKYEFYDFNNLSSEKNIRIFNTDEFNDLLVKICLIIDKDVYIEPNIDTDVIKQKVSNACDKMIIAIEKTIEEFIIGYCKDNKIPYEFGNKEFIINDSHHLRVDQNIYDIYRILIATKRERNPIIKSLNYIKNNFLKK